LAAPNDPPKGILCVDAACNWQNNQQIEFQGVWYPDNKNVFAAGPFDGGTINVAEYLAIVEGLRILKRSDIPRFLYSDSAIAIGWVKKGRVNCQSELSFSVQCLLESAAVWVKNHPHMVNRVERWHTLKWGENPADYGRKASYYKGGS
jgi:ribonuclease HI